MNEITKIREIKELPQKSGAYQTENKTSNVIVDRVPQTGINSLHNVPLSFYSLFFSMAFLLVLMLVSLMKKKGFKHE